MRTTKMTLVMVATLLLSGCKAAPADKHQSSAELLERLRKIASSPRESRPEPMMPEPQEPPLSSSTKPTVATTTPMTITTSTLPPALPIVEPEKDIDTAAAPSSEQTHSFVLAPITDQNTISQVLSQVNNFQSSTDPYNQIEVVPFRPPLIGHNNNYLNYLSYMHGRQQSIIDRFTNFAGNFFPVEIDVPDLVGSLTSWIPGANLIGQILTGNRPNIKRFAIMGGNGQVYIVDVPINPIQTPVAPARIPFEPPVQAPFSRFGAPFRPFQGGPYESFFSRHPQMNVPQDFLQRFRNGPRNPYPVDYPGLPLQSMRPDFMESRTDDVEPGMNENVFQNGFENNPNVNVLPNQMYNGNLHIPHEGLLFPRGRSMPSPTHSGVGNNQLQRGSEEHPSEN